MRSLLQRGRIRFVGAFCVLALVAAACGGDVAEDTDDPGDTDDVGVDDGDVEGAEDGEDAEDAEDAEDQETFTATLPHHMPAGGLDGQCIQQVVDDIETESGGQLTIDIQSDGALGGEADVQENLFEGVFEMSYMSTVMMGVWHEPAQVFTLPYVWTDLKDARDDIHSDTMQAVYDGLIEERGARVIGWCHYSLRSIAGGTELREPSDFQGVSIRVPETPSFVETFQALGANPTPLPYPEVYTNIQTGVVDAVDSSFKAMYDTNIHEVAEAFSETKHIFTAQALVVNEEWYQSLPDDLQSLIQEAAARAEEDFAPEFLVADEDIIPALEDAGVTVVRDVDLAALEDAVSDVRDSLAAQYGIETLLAEVLE